ncbi:hypothetical protein PGTUg99_013760 [Puccinia graminis f. sp. tritici]|uniref:Uncharacterized protein n=1 Tax=Puccinia graminis f. sp. tritici TaxID=56615 RepID=A0A5B0Q1H0_PUCGR|nr:hypothetical protein PGTUg99_013760 [Puccinia graminis f. sp. tritici]
MAKRTTNEKPAASKAPASKKLKTDPEASSSSAPAKPKWFPGKERAGPSAPGSSLLTLIFDSPFQREKKC